MIRVMIQPPSGPKVLEDMMVRPSVREKGLEHCPGGHDWGG